MGIADFEIQMRHKLHYRMIAMLIALAVITIVCCAFYLLLVCAFMSLAA